MRPGFEKAILLLVVSLSLVLQETAARSCPEICKCSVYVQGGIISDCSERLLTEIPSEDEWIDVVYLLLNSNNLTSIYDYSLWRFPIAKEINFGSNQIDTISYGAFRDLKNLEVLILENNRITELTYVDLPSSLTTLFLSFNPLDFSLSSPLPLASGDIETIVINFVDLETLDLWLISGLSHVIQFQAGGNKIKSVDLKNFAGLRNLKILYLSYNLIETILPAPEGIVLSITHLYLSYNKLTSLDSTVFNSLGHLTNLYLNYNPLVVPSNTDTPFLSHPSLEILDLSYTYAHKITNETFDLPSLLGILLEGCGISDIDTAFNAMTNLIGVQLTLNAIKMLGVDTFAKNGKLMELDLDENPLVKLDVEELRYAMGDGEDVFLDITDTPLACSCETKEISDWAAELDRNIRKFCSLRYCGITKFDDGADNPTITKEERRQGPLSKTIKDLQNLLASPERNFQSQEDSY